MDEPLMPSTMSRPVKLGVRLATLAVLGFILATAISAVVQGPKVDSGFVGVGIALFLFLVTTVFLLKWLSDDSMEDKYRYLSMVQVLASLIACASVMAVIFAPASNSYVIGGWVRGDTAISTPVIVSLGHDNQKMEFVANRECNSFRFPGQFSDGTSYKVEVKQPTPPPSQGVTCTTTGGKGKVKGGDVSNIGITCTPVKTYSVGGAVVGLQRNPVVLKNNEETLSVSTNTQFTFRNRLANGAAYRVSVVTNPTGQTCTVSNANGSIRGDDITNVFVECR